MGRPIKKKFFGNLNAPYQNQGVGGFTGVGGEGAASVVMISTGTGYLTMPSLAFPTQQIAGGTTATGAAHLQLRSVSIANNINGGTGYAVGDLLTFADGTGTAPTVRVATVSVATSATSLALVSLGDYTSVPGSTATHSASTGSGLVLAMTYAVKSVDVATAGSGYLSTGTLVFSGAAGSGAAARFTTGTNVSNSIAALSYIPTGTAAVANGDIVKQEASHRYLVRNSEGLGQCILTATTTLIPGTMNIVATDANGSTYFVTKLTSRLATLTRKAMVSSYVYATGDRARWTIDSAVGTDKTLSTTKVSIVSN